MGGDSPPPHVPAFPPPCLSCLRALRGSGTSPLPIKINSHTGTKPQSRTGFWPSALRDLNGFVWEPSICILLPNWGNRAQTYTFHFLVAPIASIPKGYRQALSRSDRPWKLRDMECVRAFKRRRRPSGDFQGQPSNYGSAEKAPLWAYLPVFSTPKTRVVWAFSGVFQPNQINN